MIHIRVKITCDVCGVVMFPLHRQDGTREVQDVAGGTVAAVAAETARGAIWSCVRLGAYLTPSRIVCSGCRRIQVAS